MMCNDDNYKKGNKYVKKFTRRKSAEQFRSKLSAGDRNFLKSIGLHIRSD